MNLFQSKSPENPQPVRQIDLRVDFTGSLLRLRQELQESFFQEFQLPTATLAPSPGLDPAPAGCSRTDSAMAIFEAGLFEGLLEAAPPAGRESRGTRIQEDPSLSMTTPSLRRRLDAAYESCNWTMASWLGKFWNGLFKRS